MCRVLASTNFLISAVLRDRQDRPEQDGTQEELGKILELDDTMCLPLSEMPPDICLQPSLV